MSDFTKLRLEPLESGTCWRVVLDAPKGNVLDAVLTGELTRVFERANAERSLKAVILEGAGKHFSFGASVEEHRPAAVADMLHTFHRLFATIAASAVPVLSAVRGQCLGGGLELVAFGHRVVASPDARLGQPEIVLGVFAPVGSAILAHRIGRGNADDLLLSGRSVGAEEARAMGLVDEIAEEPGEAALAWVQRHLLSRSASSLRFAVRAARFEFDARFATLLDSLTRLYLEGLMQTADAVEGLEAFLAKRAPRWSDA